MFKTEKVQGGCRLGWSAGRVQVGSVQGRRGQDLSNSYGAVADKKFQPVQDSNLYPLNVRLAVLHLF